MNKWVNGELVGMTAEEIAAQETKRKTFEAAERTRPLTTDDVTRLLIKQQINNLTVDDATASRMVDFYPTLRYDGSLVKANSRVNWNGRLKRATGFP